MVIQVGQVNTFYVLSKMVKINLFDFEDFLVVELDSQLNFHHHSYEINLYSQTYSDKIFVFFF